MKLALTAPLALALLGPIALPQAAAPERPWTLMIYGAADNNADGPILDFLDGIRTALDDDAGMELILFIDRSAGFSTDARSLGADFTGARVYRLRSDTAELLDASAYFEGMTPEEDFEVDSSDPANVERFVAFCKERFPARNYGLMIYSHADGCTMCPDEESGGDMHIPQLAREVDECASVDLLALELCNMGGIEIAYEWRPGTGGFSADVLVAIPNAGPPLDWDRAFARIRTAGHAPKNPGVELFDPAAMTPLEFGTLVVEEGHRGRRAMAARHPGMADQIAREAAACYDLRKAERVKGAVDHFARELSLQPGSKEILEELRDGPRDPRDPRDPGGPGGQGAVLNYVNDNFGARPYVDLYDLAARASTCDELDRETRVAAMELCRVVDDFVVASFGMDGLQGFESGVHGVFIAFPDGDGEVDGVLGKTSVWEHMDWYTPLAPESEGAPYGRWSFLADGATPGDEVIDNWFELLDAWFDEPMAGSGGHNGYMW